MKRIFCIIFFFTVSLNLWSYTRSKETFEPVIIPDKTEPFGENKKTMPEPQKFYVAGSFGYIFASVPDIQIIQDDFTNAGITGLSNVGGFFNFNLEFGYENLFQHFDAFAIIGYRFTSVKSGTGDISYGLEPVNSTVGFGLYSVPFLIGAKYSFYNTSVIKLGTRADIGVSFIRGNIDIRLNGTSSLAIQDSSLSYGGTGISTDLLMFVETKLSNMLNLEFDLGYSITSLSNVKILGASGNFATQFQPGHQLMIYDASTGQSEGFKVSMNGFTFSLSAKVLF